MKSIYDLRSVNIVLTDKRELLTQELNKIIDEYENSLFGLEEAENTLLKSSRTFKKKLILATCNQVFKILIKINN